jgi:hypothetical protein
MFQLPYRCYRNFLKLELVLGNIPFAIGYQNFGFSFDWEKFCQLFESFLKISGEFPLTQC